MTLMISMENVAKIKDRGCGALNGVEFERLIERIEITDTGYNDAIQDHASEVELHQAALGTHMENLRQCATKLADSDRLRKLAAVDLGASETHCQSLIRRLRDAESRDVIHQGFTNQVLNIVDGKPLAEEYSKWPTLLRLQEALDAVVPVAASNE